ncbi:4-aminobutyrate transaminase [Phytophthora cinnamomi]|uniref:4-aminobutyrate transaminase n=1 Tax=Phytophthora cinnamomi TaxID=4785 RepID=UPI003559AD94|nr:4-aminobutyrate transaminase [Phytophthora cinnamomi]
MAKQHLAKGIGRMSDMVMTKGKGSWIWTSDNRKLLDFTSGIAVTSVGHSHPKVVAAVQKQAATLVHAQVNIGYHQPMLDLTDKLLPVLPKSLDSLFFACSGSEAIENAVKLARHATGKSKVIAFQGGYHGRTVGTMSLTTSKTVYSAGFGPLMPGLRVALKQQSAPRDTAAIIIESVLGEGGYVVPPKSFMKGLREIASENDILLIADEVQSGFGRTGDYFAIDGHFDVQPDILAFAKGIADGYPISGIASRKELTDTQPAGSMGGTYAGNAVACAAAIATQEVIAEENVLENTRARGAQLRAGLDKLKASGKYPIQDVRGLGLMLGIEFDLAKTPKGTANKISAACLDHGMMLLTTSIYETLRFMPALTVTEDECTLALEIFEKALDDIFAK